MTITQIYTTRQGWPVATLIDENRIQWDVEPETFASAVRKGKIKVVLDENRRSVQVMQFVEKARARDIQTLAPDLLRKAFLGIARF